MARHATATAGAAGVGDSPADLLRRRRPRMPSASGSTPTNKSNIEFYKCGEGLCGKITKVVDGQKTRREEPRTQPSATGRSSASSSWRAPRRRAPTSGPARSTTATDGKSYSGTVTVKSKDAVDLSGCVAHVLCRTTTWTRVK